MMLTPIMVLAGLGCGTLLNWAADCLPRTTSRPPVFLPRPDLRPAWWRLAALARSARPTRELTLGAALELATGLAFAGLWTQSSSIWRWLGLAVAYCFLLLIATIDLKYRLVPNALVLPALAVALLAHALPPSRHTLTALLGGALGLAPFLLVALLRPGTLGGGDIKLAGLIGLALGYPLALWPVSLGILAGGLTSIVLILAGRGSPKSQIPYAPFLCLGAMVALLYNPLAALLAH
jgi:prepilin signal peptidase PulO-like enzyme (type II secretory pathway)